MRLAKGVLVFLITCFMSIVGPAIAQSASDSPSDDQILQAADQARFIEADSFVLTVDITAERPDGSNPATVRALFKRFSQDSGDGYRARIEYLQPPEMQGDIYLTVQNQDLCNGDRSCSFFWGPNLMPGQPLKVSAGTTTVFGDSTVAETTGIPFARNYTIKEKKTDTVNDRPALALSLIANDSGVPFQQVTLWVDPSNFQPIQADLFALSGQPLDRVIYEEYSQIVNDQYIRQQRIENLLQKGSVTHLTAANAEITPLSDPLFDPNQLGKS